MPRWPYICGQLAKAADAISGVTRPCPLAPGPGGSGAYECWMAGYRGEAEPLSMNDESQAYPTACRDRESIKSKNTISPEIAKNKSVTMPHHMGTVCVIDFMNLLVRAWHASPPSEMNGVRSMLDTVHSILQRLSPEYIVFAADGGYQHRAKMLPSYKTHRPAMDPGLRRQVSLAEEALRAIGWPLIRSAGYEADDVLASLVRVIGTRAAGIVLVTSDKDLLQLVGRHVQVYHPWKGGEFQTIGRIRDKFGVEPHQIADWLALVGDASDGVPGVKGIGEKKATELLVQHNTLDTLLEKARVQHITGAIGKNLREQADTATLSRALVQLVDDIPLPIDWIEWPITEPAANWFEGLKSLGLIASAQRLSQTLGIGSSRPRPPSHIEHEWIKDFSIDVVDSNTTRQTGSSDGIGGLSLIQNQDQISDRPESPMVDDAGVGANVVPSGRDSAADAQRSAQPADAQDRDLRSQPIGTRTTVILTRTGALKSKGNEDELTKWLQIQYEGGRAAARRGRSHDANPWKPGARREAWSRGFHNQPLDLASLIAIEQQPVAAAQSTQVLALPKPKQAALF